MVDRLAGTGLIRRFRITGMLLLVPLIFVGLVSGSSLIILAGNSSTIAGLETVAAQLDAAEGTLLNIEILGTAYLAGAAPDDQAGMSAEAEAFTSALDRLRANSNRSRAVSDALVTTSQRWDESATTRHLIESLAHLPSPGDQPSAVQLEEALNTQIQAAYQSLEVAATHNSADLAALRRTAANLNLAAPIALALALVLGVAVALGLSRRLAQSVLRPVLQLKKVAVGLRSGDSSRRVAFVSRDEIGELGEQFNLMAEAIADREHRLVALVENSTDGILVIDAGGRVAFTTPAFTAEFAVDSTIEQSLGDLVHPDDRERASRAWTRLLREGAGATIEIEARLRRVDGEWRDLWARFTNRLEDHAVAGMVINVTDITERRQYEQRLTHQALHDPLTGLANRELLRSRIDGVATNGRKAIAPVALLYLDLDGFKLVNDTMGHDAGDEVLRTVATRLVEAVRPQDTVARLGGDEFAIVLDKATFSDAQQVAERIIAALQLPIQVDEREVVAAASVGISSAEEGGSRESLLGDADLAMYFAKRDGKGQVSLFYPAMRLDLLDRLQLGEDLRGAISAGQIVAHYQPVVDLASGAVVGAEALARWSHPERGWIGPNVFVPLAQEMGLVYEIDMLILRQACAHGRALVEGGHPAFRMAVNVSGTDLEHPDLVTTVTRILRESKFPASNLELELTEGVAISESAGAEDVLVKLKALGLGLAIDDFGTGYSALTRLRRLPFDRLKIDKAFIDEVGTDQDGPTLVDAILDMAHVLGLQVVAEGVENAGQADYLKVRQCDFAQGYLFSRPITQAALSALMAATPGIDRAV